MAAPSISSPHGAWADNQAATAVLRAAERRRSPVLPSGDSRLGSQSVDSAGGKVAQGGSDSQGFGAQGEGGQSVGASWNTGSVGPNKKAANRLIFEKFIHLGGENG